MRYWGIDYGKRVIAMVARDVAGNVVETQIVSDREQCLSYIAPDDAILIEWCGGVIRPLLDECLRRGTRVYIYRGKIYVDRLHLGLPRKGDMQDAMTLSYVLWASLTGGAPIRPNALIDYGVMQPIYELRVLFSRAEIMTKEKVRLQNRLSTFLTAGIKESMMSKILQELEREADLAYQELRVRCMENGDVRRVLEVLLMLFPSSERAVYGLALQLAPMERFPTLGSLLRYCCVLPTHGTSGGSKVVERLRWRAGNRAARVLMFRLLNMQIGIGNGNGARRGKWRDYYEKLRKRLTHGQAMIRMMRRLLEIIWDMYHGRQDQDALWRRLRSGDGVKDQVIELVARGYKDVEVARVLGIHPSQISRWKRRDRMFLERYIRARSEAKLKEVRDER